MISSSSKQVVYDSCLTLDVKNIIFFSISGVNLQARYFGGVLCCNSCFIPEEKNKITILKLLLDLQKQKIQRQTFNFL